MTTFTQLVTAVSGMSVTGVTRQLSYTPNSISTADCPLSFPRLPGGGKPEIVSTCFASGRTKSIDLVVVIDPAGQNTTDANFAATVAMADNLETAVSSLSFSGHRLTYAISMDTAVNTDNTGYWAVVLTVTIDKL